MKALFLAGAGHYEHKEKACNVLEYRAREDS